MSSKRKNFLTRLILSEKYDLAIVPVVVSISFTSNLLARLANAKIRIGAEELDGKTNKSAFFFDRRVKLSWLKYPDSNVSERSLDIVRPFGIDTNDYRSEISFDEEDISVARKFLVELNYNPEDCLIGLHVGAGKVPNRWSLNKFENLIKLLLKNFPSKIYVTGSSKDKDEITFLKQNLGDSIGYFIDKSIPQVAALISLSDLFISNDTGIMHVAGTTPTPQISLFGPTNPFNWAPIGTDKYFIRKSELIDDISVQDVFTLCNKLLSAKNNIDKVPSNHLAAVDIGTNSFHLIVVKFFSDGSFTTLDKKRRVLRLGLETPNLISDSETQKAAQVLKEFSFIANKYNTPLRAIATSAVREASNKDQFIQKILDLTGVKIELLTGKDEALFIYKGVQKALPISNKKTLCIDIGGGSTEIILACNDHIFFAESIKLGAVRLSKKFFPDFVLTDAAVENCKDFIRKQFDISGILTGDSFDLAVGSSGTVQAAAYMISYLNTNEMPDAINGFQYTKEDLQKLTDIVLLKKTVRERILIKGMEAKRADVFPGGLLILNFIFDLFNINTITVSDYALREGIIIDSINKVNKM